MFSPSHDGRLKETDVKNEKTKKDRPFAIEFLEPLTDSETQEVNGGRHHRPHHPPIGPLTGIGTHPTASNPNWDFAQ
jgi:hypothetical protein